MCFVLVTKTLSGIKWRNRMLNKRTAVICEIWKRLKVMKATFVALKASASSVACMVTSVPRRVGALRAKASRPVEKGAGVCGAQPLVEMTGGVVTETSFILQKMLLAARWRVGKPSGVNGSWQRIRAQRLAVLLQRRSLAVTLDNWKAAERGTAF
ncbi:hypothetical protein TRVL_05179 [Trypanosoma vivax]|nr:hypothetical protein TRVL_05179 [Trypanosoma vivax]